MTRRLPEASLRAELAAGRTPVQIAQKYAVSPQAVRFRIKRLKLKTHQQIAPAIAPGEQIEDLARKHAEYMQEILRSHQRARLLQDACDQWLRDPNHPDRYTIDPRPAEIKVVYTEQTEQGPGRPRVATLAELLSGMDDRYKVEAVLPVGIDPRKLLLKAAAEIRAAVSLAAEVAHRIADARAMDEFRTVIIEEIAKVSPETADAITAAIRRQAALQDLGPRPGPGAQNQPPNQPTR